MKKLVSISFIVLLLIGFYSFASQKIRASAAVEQYWYDFVGDNPNDPMDYQLHTGAPPTCNSGSNRCAVFAVQDTELPGNYPDLQDPSIVIRNKP